MNPNKIRYRRPRAGSEGETLLKENRLVEAESAFIKEASERPRDAKPSLMLGHLALLRNDLDLAEERLQDAITRDRRCRSAHALLAEASYRRGDFAAAAEHQDHAKNRKVAAKMRSFEGRKPYAIDGPDMVRVPFVLGDPLPIVKARVNGGPEADFLIDTGGAELILDTNFAKASGVQTFGGERSIFGGGKSATLVHGATDSLALGDVTIRDLPVHVLQLGAIGPTLGVEALAGIIGTSVLYRFLATIDYPGQALVLRKKGTPIGASRGAIDVPMLMADDHFLLAEGSLNGLPPTLCLVDSGLAGGAYACPASMLKEADIDRGKIELVEGEGAGGTVKAWPFDVKSLSLGEARREDVQGIAGVFPPQLEWAYGFRIGGLVSHGFLDGYAVTFDFTRMVIRLEPRTV